MTQTITELLETFLQCTVDIVQHPTCLTKYEQFIGNI